MPTIPDIERKFTYHPPTTIPDIERRFTYHPPKGDQAERYSTLREYYKTLAYEVFQMCPDSAEREKALEFLENSNMWANAAIARNE